MSRPLARSPFVILLLAAASALAAGCTGEPAKKPLRRADAPRIEIPEAPPWRLDWARGAVFYQVFVRSFADSDGDGVGDLRGLTARLDYLNDGDPGTTDDLGVEGIWLMPVFESPSYHGYDVVDYDTIDREYGTIDDFRKLCDEAHRRGIRVIVDLVMNHSGVGHLWFREAAASPDSPRRSWYVWRRDDPGWRQPWGSGPTWHRSGDSYYYGIFWSGMPDLNLRDEAVRFEMARVASLWLDRGADGFRLDATRHLIETGPDGGLSDAPETFDVLRRFSARVRAHRPDALLVGENWTDTPAIARYYGSVERTPGGDVLPMNFNFPLASSIVEGVGEGDAARIRGVIREMGRLYPAGVLDAPFLTNHDMVRVASRLGSAPARLRTAAAILLSLPGTPFVYYGEEVGLRNAAGRGDEAKRTPMPWDGTSPGGGFTSGTPWEEFAPGRPEGETVSAQRGEPGSLLSRYREWIRLRAGSVALRRGTIELAGADEGPLLAFTRAADGESVLVVHNLGREEERALLDVRAAALDPLLVDAGVPVPERNGAAWSVALPGGASAVWRIR